MYVRSEGLIWEYCFIFHEVVGLVEDGSDFSALFFTSIFSLAFLRDDNQVCKKDYLILELSPPGIYEEATPRVHASFAAG